MIKLFWKVKFNTEIFPAKRGENKTFEIGNIIAGWIDDGVGKIVLLRPRAVVTILHSTKGLSISVLFFSNSNPNILIEIKLNVLISKGIFIDKKILRELGPDFPENREELSIGKWIELNSTFEIIFSFSTSMKKCLAVLLRIRK